MESGWRSVERVDWGWQAARAYRDPTGFSTLDKFVDNLRCGGSKSKAARILESYYGLYFCRADIPRTGPRDAYIPRTRVAATRPRRKHLIESDARRRYSACSDYECWRHKDAPRYVLGNHSFDGKFAVFWVSQMAYLKHVDLANSELHAVCADHSADDAQRLGADFGVSLTPQESHNRSKHADLSTSTMSSINAQHRRRAEIFFSEKFYLSVAASMEYPRRGRGAAAIRLRGRPPRNITSTSQVLARPRLPVGRVAVTSPRGSSKDGSRRRRGRDVDIPWRRGTRASGTTSSAGGCAGNSERRQKNACVVSKAYTPLAAIQTALSLL